MKKKSYISWEVCQYSICKQENIDKLKNTLKKEKKLQDIVEYSKIMSDKTRSNIIYLIFKNWNLCVCDLANILDMSSQAISSQLIKLYDKWIIKREKKWLTVFYSLLDEDFLSFLKHIL
jgi:ArsR family transcriptional regulator